MLRLQLLSLRDSAETARSGKEIAALDRAVRDLCSGRPELLRNPSLKVQFEGVLNEIRAQAALVPVRGALAREGCETRPSTDEERAAHEFTKPRVTEPVAARVELRADWLRRAFDACPLPGDEGDDGDDDLAFETFADSLKITSGLGARASICPRRLSKVLRENNLPDFRTRVLLFINAVEAQLLELHIRISRLMRALDREAIFMALPGP